MLKLTIEILPGGDGGRAKKLAVLDIANVSGLAPVSDYALTLDGKYLGSVIGHPREKGMWPLLARAVQKVEDELARRGSRRRPVEEKTK